MENKQYKIALVAPCHIQPSKEWVQSLQSISTGRSNVRVIIVDDSNGKIEMPGEFDVYDYDRQEEEMGEEMYKKFERFHKSSSCKNFGHWIAWRDGFDIIIGLDSDCLVPPNFIGQHIENLLSKSHGWTNTIRFTEWFPRGYPYKQRNLRTALSLGLWSKELDLYGQDRLDNPKGDTSFLALGGASSEIADGFVALSGMNWACWADVIPALLFLPNFEVVERDIGNGAMVHRFRRHDDIWGGYIFQKMMCMKNERIVFGNPIVTHDTVVDAEKDAKEEEAMIAWENIFYNAVDQLVQDASEDMEGEDYEGMMGSLAVHALEAWRGTEWQPLAEALEFWSALFESTQIK